MTTPAVPEQTLLGKPIRYWWAVLQNVVVTFGLVFLALWLAPVAADWASDPASVETDDVQALFDWSVITKAAVATLGAFLSFIKSLVGGALGNKATPSFLPGSLDPATPPPAADADDGLNTDLTDPRNQDGAVSSLVVTILALIGLIVVVLLVVNAVTGK